MVIRCVTFIGKLNQPLCFRCYGVVSELPIQMAIYGSLDVVEAILSKQQERQQQQKSQTDDGARTQTTSLSADPYLGFLIPALGAPSSASLAAWAGCPSISPHDTTTQAENTSQNETSLAMGELPQLGRNQLPIPVDLAVFGYVSSSNLKIMAVIEERGGYSDPDLRMLFRQLHRLYADAICNPFFVDSLNTPRFLSELDQTVYHFSQLLIGG